MSLPSICIVTAAAKDDANLVWLAMGRGPNTFTRKLCAIDEGVTWETTPTHYLMADSSSSESDVAAWQAMANGDLPQIEGVWGEDDVIDAASAMEATSAANLQVYSASGDVIPTEHAAGILGSRNLMLVPDPPL
jgi:hypothetical protein